jgi:alpha-beta hydrolase superfamily lysophospholipase
MPRPLLRICFAIGLFALLNACAMLPLPRLAAGVERHDLLVQPDPSVPVRAAVLAIHGINGSADTFAEAARSWAGQGIATRAVNVDFAAAGPGLVHAELERNRAIFPDAIQLVVAESLGASLAIVALADPAAPRVDGLVLLAPAIWPESVSATLLAGAFDLAYDLSNSEAARTWGRIVGLMDKAGSRSADLTLDRIIVLTGGRDQVVPDLGTWRLSANLAHAEYRELPEGGHALLSGLNHAMLENQIAGWMLDSGGSQLAESQLSAGSAAVALQVPPAGGSPP